MDISLEPGRYVLAVSGGIDSMALLDILRRYPGIKLTVAHFDHGIRDDSHEDRKLVQKVAARHGLPFVYAHGNLGSDASEATAREARYEFLHKVRHATGARAIITAHHQDDLLETVVMNIMRGTGRKGLSPLTSLNTVHRPILHVSKKEIIRHANDNQLIWRDDKTNADTKYMRNHIRHNVLPRLSPEAKEQLLNLIRSQAAINQEIETLLSHQLHFQDSRETLGRAWFLGLSHKVAKEVLATWLRSHKLGDFDRKALERLVVGAKVSRPGRALDVIKNYQLHVEPKYLSLKKT